MRDQLWDFDPDIVLWDDCDDALIGYVEQCGTPPVACYLWAKLVACFVARGMTDDEAVEWIGFNVTGAYVGERTPVVLYKP